jgi:LPPG:FO 2-phospho-L-lactate transferase
MVSSIPLTGEPRVVALAGGVGGARLAHGLAQSDAGGLAVIVNTGDDFRHLGLAICPDIDTVLYTLGGLANRSQGWGIEGESWSFMDQLKRLGGPAWFQLGDRDVALHALRTSRLEKGDRLTEVVADIADALGIASRVLPMSDTPVPTVVSTADGDLPFQDYFVRLRCEVAVTGFRFEGIAQSRPTPQVEQALRSPQLEAIVICPSNPFVSIAPILGVPGMRDLIKAAGVPVVAVSPIVAGAAIKGPAAKMMKELGHPSTAAGVAEIYAGLIDGFVIDNADRDQTAAIEALGMAVMATDAIMTDDASRRRLGTECLDFARSIRL